MQSSGAGVPPSPAQKAASFSTETRKHDAQWAQDADLSEADAQEEGPDLHASADDEEGSDDDEYFRRHFKAASEAVSAEHAAAGGEGYDDRGEDGEGDDGLAGRPEEEDSRYPPDLILPDGRVISRKPRAGEDGADVDESKKNIAMAGAMKEEGNRNFADAKYDTAAACYSEALRFAPSSVEFEEHKAVFYANRAACYLHMGETEAALYDCDRALEHNPRYVKAVARRVAVFERFQKLEEALADAELWAMLEPKSHQAKDTVSRLKKSIAERDEKLKEEMMGKLKDMGNWVLGKFGLSVDNFKAVQDPKTGSYSISFQK